MHSVEARDSDVFTPCPQPVKVWSKIVSKRASWVAMLSLVFWQSGCGDGTIKPSTPRIPADISISPGSATVGSPDLTQTILGSKNFTFFNGHWYSTVLSSQDSVDTPLLTTFDSNSQLTAIVPAALLASAVTGNIRVEIWDRIENTRVATSSSVPFQVTSTPIPTPSISSISPATVAAGSPDVTITINGWNFGHYGHFIWSTAFWTTNGNLHDTGTWLQTTIFSSSQLRAVIPAKLLQSPNLDYSRSL